MTEVSLLNPRTLTGAINVLPPMPIFLRQTFFNATQAHDTEHIETDLTRETEKMAPLSQKNAPAKNVAIGGYKTQFYQPANIRIMRITTVDQLLTRRAGQPLYSDLSIQQHAAERVGEDLKVLRDMAERRIAYMCAQVLTTGTVTTLDDETGTVLETIDFGMPADHKSAMASGDYWSTESAKPINDIIKWQEMVWINGRRRSDILVFGMDSYISFINNKQVSGTDSLFDTNKIAVGKIDPSMLSDGTVYLGTLKLTGMDCYVCTDTVQDTNGNTVYLMPKNKVLMGSRNANNIIHYGVARDLEAPKKTAFFSKSFVQPDPSARFILLQSSPLPVMHRADTFLCKQVVA
jgi:hypothetical protein